MLVDDDLPVLEYLSEAIPWNALGLEVQAMCVNGAQAYEHAEQRMPDILLTDIGMPEMDGLTLVNALKLKSKRLRTVILSCHDEFEYAQKAVKLNVDDYVLKETMSAKTLQPILESMVQKLDEETNAQGEREAMRRRSERNKSVSKETFLRQFLSTPLLDERPWISELAQLGMSVQNRVLTPVWGFVHRYTEQEARFHSPEVMSFAIENLLDEALEHQGVVFRMNSREFIILFPTADDLKVNRAEGIADCLQSVQGKLNQYLRMPMTFVTGEPAGDLGQLKKQLSMWAERPEIRFYLPERAVLPHRVMNSQFANRPLFADVSEAMESIRKRLLEENRAGIRELISDWFRAARDAQIHPEQLRNFALRMMMDTQSKLHSLQHFLSSYTTELLHRSVATKETVHELEDWMQSFYEEALTVMATIAKSSRRTEIAEAKRYVELHLHTKISLEEVAGMLHLNPSYFSRLFKKETDMSFIEYVTGQKMEKAKLLLRESGKPIQEIALMLGFETTSYFNKVFKDFTGHKPSEYI
ncbi:helix-turn-helix domain-containing protein [Paenibacillus swuensis]|nr:helix-turn-helix domain-containing protein [Paenibacillus swuensis]